MIVRPVDMQGMVQRSQDVTNIKTQEDAKYNTDQNNLMTTHIKELQHKQENVIRKEDVDMHEEKYDAKEKGKNEYYSNKNKKKKQEAKKDGKVTEKSSQGIDVRI